jgi:hypothetical protein
VQPAVGAGVLDANARGPLDVAVDDLQAGEDVVNRHRLSQREIQVL